jgi:hypothetical protein
MDTTIHTRRADIAAERARAHKPTIIVAAPAFDRRGRRLHGRFDALLGDLLLAHATVQPLLAGARALLRHGVAASTPIVLRHAGSDVDSLRSTAGAAAALTVAEGDRGALRFRAWKAVPVREGSVLIARRLPAA